MDIVIWDSSLVKHLMYEETNNNLSIVSQQNKGIFPMKLYSYKVESISCEHWKMSILQIQTMSLHALDPSTMKRFGSRILTCVENLKSKHVSLTRNKLPLWKIQYLPKKHFWPLN